MHVKEYDTTVTAYVVLDPGELTVKQYGGKSMAVDTMRVTWQPEKLGSGSSLDEPYATVAGRWILKNGQQGKERHSTSRTLMAPESRPALDAIIQAVIADHHNNVRGAA